MKASPWPTATPEQLRRAAAGVKCYNGEAAPGLTPNAAPDTLRVEAREDAATD